MKNNKYIITAIGFLSGMVFGIATIGFFSFSNGPASPVPAGGVVPITAAEARNYYSRYISEAGSFNQVLKGFTIDKAQLEAMNNIAKENPALTVFRIYMGKDNNSRKIGIVVGVDEKGLDAVKNTIYNTDSQNLSPCPPVCDLNSPIAN